MPWGTSEGGIPQPYRMEIKSAHWGKARDRDGELVTNRQGENLLNLIFEGDAHRLIEEEDGSFSVGEAIEPVDGKHNRRSFLIGNTAQWIDPREDGSVVEATRGPDEMPWAKSEVGRLINSLVELVGTDTLESWGDWEKAETWSGRSFDLVPKHDLDADDNPITYKTRTGEEKIDWYFIAVAESDGTESETGEAAGAETTAETKPARRSRKSSDGLLKAVQAAYKAFKGNEDEFVNFIETDEFAEHEALAKLDDPAFDALIDKAVG